MTEHEELKQLRKENDALKEKLDRMRSGVQRLLEESAAWTANQQKREQAS
jgi:cell division protein FtsB